MTSEWLPLLLAGLSVPAVPVSAVEARERPQTIGFLLIDGVYGTELVAPMDVLQHVTGRVPDAPRVFTVGLTREPVRTAEGLRIVPDHTIDDAPEADVLVVGSTLESRGKDRENERLVSWLKKAGAKAEVVMSLCWGAFLLAEAGLLDGGPATTFPTDYDLFERDYPRVQVKRDVSFVDSGKAITSAGGVKSYEAAMYLVEEIYGTEVALGIAAGLLIEWDVAKVKKYLP